MTSLQINPTSEYNKLHISDVLDKYPCLSITNDFTDENQLVDEIKSTYTDNEILFILQTSFAYFINELEVLTAGYSQILVLNLIRRKNFLFNLEKKIPFARVYLTSEVLDSIEEAFSLYVKSNSEFLQRRLLQGCIENLVSYLRSVFQSWKLLPDAKEFVRKKNRSVGLYHSFLIPNNFKHVYHFIKKENEKNIEKMEDKCRCTFYLSNKPPLIFCGYQVMEILFDVFHGNYLGCMDMLEQLVFGVSKNHYFIKHWRSIIRGTDGQYIIFHKSRYNFPWKGDEGVNEIGDDYFDQKLLTSEKKGNRKRCLSLDRTSQLHKEKMDSNYWAEDHPALEIIKKNIKKQKFSEYKTEVEKDLLRGLKIRNKDMSRCSSLSSTISVKRKERKKRKNKVGRLDSSETYSTYSLSSGVSGASDFSQSGKSKKRKKKEKQNRKGKKGKSGKKRGKKGKSGKKKSGKKGSRKKSSRLKLLTSENSTTSRQSRKNKKSRRGESESSEDGSVDGKGRKKSKKGKKSKRSISRSPSGSSMSRSSSRADEKGNRKDRKKSQKTKKSRSSKTFRNERNSSRDSESVYGEDGERLCGEDGKPLRKKRSGKSRDSRKKKKIEKKNSGGSLASDTSRDSRGGRSMSKSSKKRSGRDSGESGGPSRSKSKGSRGSRGPIESKGSKGSRGPIGSKGSKGSRGPIGSKGSFDSYEGTDGNDGSDSYGGTDKYGGPSGSKSKGSKGSRGPIGSKGSKGSKGSGKYGRADEEYFSDSDHTRSIERDRNQGTRGKKDKNGDVYDPTPNLKRTIKQLQTNTDVNEYVALLKEAKWRLMPLYDEVNKLSLPSVFDKAPDKRASTEINDILHRLLFQTAFDLKLAGVSPNPDVKNNIIQHIDLLLKSLPLFNDSEGLFRTYKIQERLTDISAYLLIRGRLDEKKDECFMLSHDLLLIEQKLFGKSCVPATKNIFNRSDTKVLYHSFFVGIDASLIEPFLREDKDRRVSKIERTCHCRIVHSKHVPMIMDIGYHMVEIYYDFDYGNHFGCIDMLEAMLKLAGESQKKEVRSYRTIVCYPSGERLVMQDLSWMLKSYPLSLPDKGICPRLKRWYHRMGIPFDYDLHVIRPATMPRIYSQEERSIEIGDENRRCASAPPGIQ